MREVKISARLRQDADAIWQGIIRQPFVIELYQGDLPLEKFKFYVLQDYNFLVAMMKTLAILAAKAGSAEVAREMLALAHLEATGEFESYEDLLGKLGYAIGDAIKAEPTEVNTSYTGFLIATTSLRTFWEGLAAILPCFWSYSEITEYHRDKLKGNTNRLYTEWASVYLSEPYRNLVSSLRALLDTAHHVEYEKLKEVFIIASKYEAMFWSTAYEMKA